MTIFTHLLNKTLMGSFKLINILKCFDYLTKGHKIQELFKQELKNLKKMIPK